MAATRHIYVFAYDVERDSARARIAALLEGQLLRVQFSVFEGRLTESEAERLAQSIFARMGPEDSLRVYALTHEGRALSFVKGPGAPLAEHTDFIVL